jgi:hypothetical protein
MLGSLGVLHPGSPDFGAPLMVVVVMVNAIPAWSTVHFQPEARNSSSVRITNVGCVHVFGPYCPA